MFLSLPFAAGDKIKFSESDLDIKSDINSMIPDDVISTHVNSKYFNIKEFNSLKLDLPSSFEFFHVNIASLNKHIGEHSNNIVPS